MNDRIQILFSNDIEKSIRFITNFMALIIVAMCWPLPSGAEEMRNNTSDVKKVATANGTNEFDWRTPREVLEKEAADENPEALLYLAMHHMTGLNGYEKDEKQIAEFCQRGSKLADLGTPAAQCCRAFCFQIGIDVEQNDEKAFEWFQKAVGQGYAPAQYELVFFHADGVATTKDMDEALRCCRKAADQGYAPAQCWLGLHYDRTGNAKEAIKWFRKSGEQGWAQAQFLLGICYLQGISTEKDASEAVEWFQKAAEQGDAPSLFSLGACFENAWGVRKNLDKTLEYFQLAAERGHVDAQHIIAVYHANRGEYQESLKWYHLAAEQGHVDAQVRLADYYGGRKEYEKAIKWYQKLAERENAVAMFRLGLCLYHGEGAEMNAEDGIRWLQKAAEAGYQPAIEWGNNTRYFLSPDRKAEEDAERRTRNYIDQKARQGFVMPVQVHPLDPRNQYSR